MPRAVSCVQAKNEGVLYCRTWSSSWWRCEPWSHRSAFRDRPLLALVTATTARWRCCPCSGRDHPLTLSRQPLSGWWSTPIRWTAILGLCSWSQVAHIDQALLSRQINSQLASCLTAANSRPSLSSSPWWLRDTRTRVLQEWRWCQSTRPDWPVDFHLPQQIRIDRMLGVRLGRIGTLVYGL